ncbi:MAG: histidine--tRNA ligase [Proteobacteria bacterium]|nr:histidine--tRNA ligase [Pseudomonadota bacterium]
MIDIIHPRIPRGTRDFLPKDMAKRQFVMEKIKSVFVNFGYNTIETPAIEYAETLLGQYGDEDSKLTYTFKDKGGREIALRYDQTVPFARFVAAHNKNLPMPFKRYQISQVWRADKPGKGRYREFYQCDVDIIGTGSLLAEGEVAKVVNRVFEVLGFDLFVIEFNSRRLMNSILRGLDVPPKKQRETIRVLDKLGRIGQEGVAKELTSLMRKPALDKLLDIVTVRGSNEERIAYLREYDTREISDFLEICEAFGIPGKRLVFDLSLARGLDYYTGIVIEAFLQNVDIGAVCAGGRYDGLCSLFSQKRFSGVGVAFGFDRIMLAMEELDMFLDVKMNSRVLVTYFDASTLKNSLKILSDLQSSGINAEIYFEPEKLGKQLKYADRNEIPFVVICGPDEIERGEATIKVMKTGKQKKIPQNQLTAYLNGYNYVGKR